MKKIDKPKVFISYAWGEEEYQQRVLGFAISLMSNGVDVLLDKWDLTEGNDKYAYMEKSVNDKTITNVLLLINPEYARKSNSKEGGVGTETQIISPEIYNNHKQDKFLPVIFERDKEGNIMKPTYLNTALHFDLSNYSNNYDSEYKRLVCKLFGVQKYPKPQLGDKPEWVTNDMDISNYKNTDFKINGRHLPSNERIEIFTTYLNEIESDYKKIINTSFNYKWEEVNNDEVTLNYRKLQIIRDKVISAMTNIYAIDDVAEYIGKFLERIYNFSCTSGKDYDRNNRQIFLHDLFLNIIAYLLKKEQYKTIGYLLKKTYYKEESTKNVPKNFIVFLAENPSKFLGFLEEKNKKHYKSVLPVFLMQNINEEILDSSLIALADVICFNFTIFSKNYAWKNFWKPVIYDSESQLFQSKLELFISKMVGKEISSKYILMFGYNKIDDFTFDFGENVLRLQQNYWFSFNDYSQCLMSEFIKPEDIAKYN